MQINSFHNDRFYITPVALFEAQFCELFGQPASIQSFSFWLHNFTFTFAYSELRQHKQIISIDFNDDQGISHLICLKYQILPLCASTCIQLSSHTNHIFNKYLLKIAISSVMFFTTLFTRS